MRYILSAIFVSIVATYDDLQFHRNFSDFVVSASDSPHQSRISHFVKHITTKAKQPLMYLFGKNNNTQKNDRKLENSYDHLFLKEDKILFDILLKNNIFYIKWMTPLICVFRRLDKDLAKNINSFLPHTLADVSVETMLKFSKIAKRINLSKIHDFELRSIIVVANALTVCNLSDIDRGMIYSIFYWVYMMSDAVSDSPKAFDENYMEKLLLHIRNYIEPSLQIKDLNLFIMSQIKLNIIFITGEILFNQLYSDFTYIEGDDIELEVFYLLPEDIQKVIKFIVDTSSKEEMMYILADKSHCVTLRLMKRVTDYIA